VTADGHLGLFMSRLALPEHWPALLAQIVRHSTTHAGSRP